MSVVTISDMVGAVIDKIDGEQGDERLAFHTNDGRVFIFEHSQNCCETVAIEDIAGDLSDLVGSPILMAEEVSSDGAPEVQADSYTWTFYKYATIKGSVTVRWLGTSNGYYSEGVWFRIENGKVCDAHEDCKESKILARACWLAQ